MRIHLSPHAFECLASFPGYQLASRGGMEIKVRPKRAKNSLDGIRILVPEADYLEPFVCKSFVCKTTVSCYIQTSLYWLNSLLDKMAAISHTTFSNAFSWMKGFVFRFKFHWSLFPWVQLTVSQHWFGQWLGTEVITWSNADPVYRCICVALGRDVAE